MRTLLFGSALLLAAANAAAQCTLTVTGTGAPGTSLTFAVDGSTPSGFAFLAIGDTQGTTTVALGPLGTLTLGLAFPFGVVPMGPTDAQGDASLTIDIPAGVTGSADLFAQGVTLGVTLGGGMPTLSLCATNVVGFHVGV
jgi:hypothetical protein